MTSEPEKTIRIGVLSDTHGHLDNRVFERFEGVDAILHAGDVGRREILIDLGAWAPTYAILGNVDQGGDCWNLPLQETVRFGGVRIYMNHGHLQSDPSRRIQRILEASRKIGPDVVIVGHSHRPYLGDHEGVIFLNPGSASRPRFGFPPSVALITVNEGNPEIGILDLDGNPVTPDKQI